MKWTEIIFLAGQLAAIIEELDDEEDAEIPVHLSFKAVRKRYLLEGTLTKTTKPPKPRPEPASPEEEGEA